MYRLLDRAGESADEARRSCLVQICEIARKHIDILDAKRSA